MARGQRSPVGARRRSPNGYWYTKVEEDGKQFWKLDHHIVAEKHILNRSLTADERVIFRTGDTDNLSPDNLQVVKKGKVHIRRRIGQVEARIAELQGELENLQAQLRTQETTSSNLEEN